MSGSSLESDTQLGRYLLGSTEILFSLVSLTLVVKFSRYLYRKSSIEFNRALAPVSPGGAALSPSQRTLSRQPTISRINTGSVSLALNNANNPCLRLYLQLKLTLMKKLDHWLNEGVQCPLPCLCCFCPCCLTSDAGTRVMKGFSSAQCGLFHWDGSMIVEWDLEVPLLDISTVMAIWLSVLYLSVSCLSRFVNRGHIQGNHDYCRLLAYPIYYSFHYSRFFLYSAWNIRLYTAFHGTTTAYPSWVLVLFQVFNFLAFICFASVADIVLVDTSFKTNDDDVTYCTSTGVTWGFVLSGSLDFVLTTITFLLFVYPLWTVSRTFDRSARERQEKLEKQEREYREQQKMQSEQKSLEETTQTTRNETRTVTSERDSYLTDEDDDFDSSLDDTTTDTNDTHSGINGSERHKTATIVTTVSNGIRLTETVGSSGSGSMANGEDGRPPSGGTTMTNSPSIQELSARSTGAGGSGSADSQIADQSDQTMNTKKRRRSKKKRKRSNRRSNENRMRHVVVKNAVITTVMVFTVLLGLVLLGAANTSSMVRVSVMVTCLGLMLMYKEYDPLYHALFGRCHRWMYQCQCA